MKKNIAFCVPMLGFVLCMALLTACEKVVISDDGDNSAKGNFVVSVAGTELFNGQTDTRAATDVTKVCSRLSFAIYQDGKRVKYVNQKLGDNDYGTVSFSIAEGEYQLLILGHSGAGSPSTTNPQKIQFTNPTSSNGTGFTDTFYYYGTVSVGSGQQTNEYLLKRATAMFQLVTTDVKPSNIRQFYFYYTGGSGALDVTTGYGCVNSKQAVLIPTDETSDGKTLSFNLYTFLHNDTGTVSFSVQAIGSDGNTKYEHEFKEVPMQRNTITRYSGQFFVSDTGTVTPEQPNTPSTPNSLAPTLVCDTLWANTVNYSF